MPAPQSSPKSASSQRVAPTLWAVASGKGGVGKSVVSSSLAIGLAQSGPRVVAVDLDLGGANLHTHFGCETARHTLADVLRGKVPSLEDAFAETSIPGVRLLSGARSPLDAANLKFAQKQKLLRDLRKVDAAHVVLDIGAGSAFNTLDAFLVADRRVLVITPEKPAIENAYHFLKAAFFRSLRSVAKEPEVQGVLLRVLDDARRRGATPRELVEAALETDVHAGNRLRAAMRAFEVELVVNRVEQDGHDPGPEMAAACEGHLGAVLRPVASLLTDAAVPAAVEREVPVLQLFPGSAFSKGIHQMVEALLDPDLRKRRRKAPAPVSLSAKASARLAERRAATRQERVRVRPPERPSDVVLPAFTGDDPAGHLRLCRELQGHSLETMASRTKIRKLAELEDEAFAALPPEPYLRGYVQQYAQMLGIQEADEVAAAYLERFHENRIGKRQSWRQAMMKALGLGGKKARAAQPEPEAKPDAADAGDAIHRNAAAAVELACAGGPELDFEVELAPH